MHRLYIDATKKVTQPFLSYYLYIKCSIFNFNMNPVLVTKIVNIFKSNQYILTLHEIILYIFNTES